ncbi:hypothetical protein [Viscerimonas tarda]
MVKSEFIRLGVNETLVRPPLGNSAGELKLSGVLKTKDQDICIIPNHLVPIKEELTYDGLLNGYSDKYGIEYTKHILSINVRSQLSSAAKNFDTLYERTFAEALNLHLRCPKMVLGELYMIPVKEYESKASKNKKVEYRSIKGIDKHIEKYLLSFSAINERIDEAKDFYKYERVCLLIVDFSARTPKIYNTDDELRKDGLLPMGSRASIENLSFPTFASDLLSIYTSRFGTGKFT